MSRDASGAGARGRDERTASPSSGGLPHVTFETMADAEREWRIDAQAVVGRGMRGVVVAAALPAALSREEAVVKVLPDEPAWRKELDVMRALLRDPADAAAGLLCPALATASVRREGRLLIALRRYERTMWQWANARPRSAEAWAEVLAQVLVAIHGLHQRRVLHGDLSPHNVMVSSLARPRAPVEAWVGGERVRVPRRHAAISLIDFGEAQLVDERDRSSKAFHQWDTHKDLLGFLHKLWTWGARARLLAATGSTSSGADGLLAFFRRDRGPVDLRACPATVGSPTITRDREDADARVAELLRRYRELWEAFDAEVMPAVLDGSPLPRAVLRVLRATFDEFRAHRETRGYKTKYLIPAAVVRPYFEHALAPDFVRALVAVADGAGGDEGGGGGGGGGGGDSRWQRARRSRSRSRSRSPSRRHGAHADRRRDDDDDRGGDSARWPRERPRHDEGRRRSPPRSLHRPFDGPRASPHHHHSTGDREWGRGDAHGAWWPASSAVTDRAATDRRGRSHAAPPPAPAGTSGDDDWEQQRRRRRREEEEGAGRKSWRREAAGADGAAPVSRQAAWRR